MADKSFDWFGGRKITSHRDGSGPKPNNDYWDDTSFLGKQWKQAQLQTIVGPQLYDSDVELLHSKILRHIETNNALYQRATPEMKLLVQDIVTEELVHDVFSIYYTPNSIITLSPKVNPVRWRLIDSIYNFMIRSITENNALRSYFFAREIVDYVVTVFLHRMMSGSDEKPGIPESLQKLASQLGSSTKSGGENESELDEIMKSMDANSKMLNAHLTRASRDGNEASKFMDQFSKQAGSGQGSDISVAVRMSDMMTELRALGTTKSAIKQMLQSILKTGVSYFQLLKGFNEELLIETAQQSPDILDLEYMLSDVFGRFHSYMLTQVGVRSPRYAKKIIVYIDTSGSMGTTRTAGSNLIKAKCVALILMKLGIVKGVHFFDDGVRPELYTDPLSIIKFESSGGTNFQKVIDHVDTHKMDSIVITDGEGNHYDHMYKKNIFWIGVGGAQFNCFRAGVNKDSTKYITHRQCVLIDAKGGVKYYDK